MNAVLAKTCFKCGTVQPLEDFYKNPTMADGRLNKCKSCTRRDTNKNYYKHHERYKAYGRAQGLLPSRALLAAAYRRTPAGKRSMRKGTDKWMKANPLITAVQRKTHKAIQRGELVRLPCEVCGNPKVDAHHDDYSKPLDVRWLCRTHHAEHHRLKRAKERGEIV